MRHAIPILVAMAFLCSISSAAGAAGKEKNAAAAEKAKGDATPSGQDETKDEEGAGQPEGEGDAAASDGEAAAEERAEQPEAEAEGEEGDEGAPADQEGEQPQGEDEAAEGDEGAPEDEAAYEYDEEASGTYEGGGYEDEYYGEGEAGVSIEGQVSPAAPVWKNEFYLGLKGGVIPWSTNKKGTSKLDKKDGGVSGSFQVFMEYSLARWFGLGADFQLQILKLDYFENRVTQMDIDPSFRFLIPASMTGGLAEPYLRIAGGMSLDGNRDTQSEIGANIGEYLGVLFRVSQVGIVVEAGFQSTFETNAPKNLLTINVGFSAIDAS